MTGDLVETSKAKATGITSCILAVFALGDVICGIILKSYGVPSGSGIWSGIGMAITAALGIVVWVKQIRTVMVFYLVMNILMFVLDMVQIIIALIGWLVWYVMRNMVEEKCRMVGDTCHCSGRNKIPVKLSDCHAIYKIERCFTAIVVMSSLALVLLMVGSIIGCMATCCAKNENRTEVVVIQQPGVVVHTQATMQPPLPPTYEQPQPPTYEQPQPQPQEFGQPQVFIPMTGKQ